MENKNQSQNKVDDWGFPVNEGGSNQESDFYKLKDKVKDGNGDTKIRILTRPVAVFKLQRGVYPNTEDLGYVESDYQPAKGESVQIRGWVWAVIRETGELKIITLPYSVVSLIQQLRSNEEYAFEDFPMPYDITIHNTGEGAARYSITAARQNTPVSPEETAALEKQTPIEDIVRRMKEKRLGKAMERVSPVKEGVEYPEENININDIPF